MLLVEISIESGWFATHVQSLWVVGLCGPFLEGQSTPELVARKSEIVVLSPKQLSEHLARSCSISVVPSISKQSRDLYTGLRERKVARLRESCAWLHLAGA